MTRTLHTVATGAPLSASVDRVAAGDRRALRQLYDEHSPRVMGICLALLKDRQEAEDLVQETFVEVWRRSAEFDPARGSPTAWIVSIARSRAIDRRRAQQSSQRAVAAAESEPPRPGPPRPLDLAQARQDHQRVAAALDQLPPEQRTVIELAYFEGLSQREIAEQRREPLGTVKTRVRLAMEKLGLLLAETGVAP